MPPCSGDTHRHAASACLVDEDLLDLRRRRATASERQLQAPVVATEPSSQNRSVRGDARTLDRSLGRLARRDRRRRRSARRVCQSVVPEPVPHGRLAAPERIGDLRDRSTVLDERLEFLAGEATPRGVLLAVDGPQPVLLTQ